jgi:hypothetical protein
MAFCDSHLFEIQDSGEALHVRTGDSYAEKALNGVSLDDSCRWENEMWHLVECTEPVVPDVVVGERINQEEHPGTSMSYGKERDEETFNRARVVPTKKKSLTKKKSPTKKKKFPTKPRPKHPQHKRVPKVARELGDLGRCTERVADAELDEVHCNPNTVCPFDDPSAIRYVMDTRSRQRHGWHKTHTKGPPQSPMAQPYAPLPAEREIHDFTRQLLERENRKLRAELLARAVSLPGMGRRSRKLVGTCEGRVPNLRPCLRRACPLC